MNIQRAMITSQNNALLYNSEGFSFNQIKKDEILLKDTTRTPWYILYFNRNVNAKSGTFTVNTTNTPYDIAVSSYDTSIYKAGTYHYLTDYNYKVKFNPSAIPGGGMTTTLYFDYQTKTGTYETKGDFGDNTAKYTKFTQGASECTSKFNNNIFTVGNKVTMAANLATALSYTPLTQITYNTLVNGPSQFILRDTTASKYYTVNIYVTSEARTRKITAASTPALNTTITTLMDANLTRQGNFGTDWLEVTYDYTINITATELEYNSTISWSIDPANKASCKDAPYYIVAIPKYTVDFEYEYEVPNPDTSEDAPPTITEGGAWICSQEYNESFINAIINAYGTGGAELIDIQLLPYFPYLPRLPLTSNNTTSYSCILNIDEEVSAGRISPYQFSVFGTPNTSKCTCAFYIDTATFTFDITKYLSMPNRTTKDYLNYKISNEVDLYRLCSPNYNGLFEFSNAKNLVTEKFNVDCTLRPFNPYIHINPVFKGLYGQDFDDQRGLICQGDFSLPLINDP